MANRLFAFGCSFTQYQWPTWADIVGRNFDYFENWGKPGAGNTYIFHSLIECFKKHQFTSEDTIIIMWSCSTRTDSYKANQWHTTPARTYDDVSHLVKNYDVKGHLLQSLSLIVSAKELLDKWGVKYKFLSMVPVDFSDIYRKDDNPHKELIDFYKVEILPSFYEVIYNFNWKYASDFLPETPEQRYTLLKRLYNGVKGASWPTLDDFLNKTNLDEATENEINSYRLLDATNYADPHPSPEMHLKYVQKVLPEFVISSSTTEWIKNYQFNDSFDQHLPQHRL